MPTDAADAWERCPDAYQESAHWPADVVHFGPDLPSEADLRLLGELRGRRVLDLGCGAGQNSVAMARAGATVIGVDSSAGQLAAARALADSQEVRLELRHGDLADLAFLRADSVDVVLAADVLGYVEDLGRALRQVHRVLKVGAPLVLSLPHPAWYLVAQAPMHPPVVQRSYFDPSPVGGMLFEGAPPCYPHRLAELFGGLVRSSYRLEQVLEPEPAVGVPRSSTWAEAANLVPRMLLVRARKEGS